MAGLRPSGRTNASAPTWVSLGSALCLQLGQQLLDAVFLFQGGEAVFYVVGQELGFGFADGFFAGHLFLHAVEGCGLGIRAHAGLGVGGSAGGAGAAVLRDQQIGFGVGFGQFLIEIAQRRFQILNLGFLIFELLREVGAQIVIAFDAQQSGTGEVVVLFVDGELGLAHPLLDFVVVLEFLLFEQMLVCDSDGNLRFYLQELVVHVEDDLLDHFFGLFSFVDQIVEVGPD